MLDDINWRPEILNWACVLVVFVPLGTQSSIIIYQAIHRRTANLDELKQIASILLTEVLCEVKTILTYGVKTARATTERRIGLGVA